jgi:hypothetical protein
MGRLCRSRRHIIPMPDRAYSILTGARVVASDNGQTSVDRLRPLHFARTDFVLKDGRVIHVLDGLLKSSDRTQPPCLFVLKGKVVTNDGLDPDKRRIPDAEADVQDESFALSETVNLDPEYGYVVPPMSPSSIEGGKLRSPGWIERRLAGDKSLA